MKAIEIVLDSMRASERLALMLLEDMKDAPLTRPTPRGGNHPLWVAGHLAFIEGALFASITGENNPLAHWATLFGGGTQPGDDAARYPAFDEVLVQLRRLRAANIVRLEQLDDHGLDRADAMFGTLGRACSMTSIHAMLHLGQVADARRVLGRAPFMDGPPAPQGRAS